MTTVEYVPSFRAFFHGPKQERDYRGNVVSVSLEEELRWCSDGALTILTLRGSRSGSCLWEDRCWEPRCVMTGWKRTSGKSPFFTDEQQHCRSGFFFFLLFGNGKIFASELYLEVEAVLSLSIGMTALMGSAGSSDVHSSALQAQHPSPW